MIACDAPRLAAGSGLSDNESVVATVTVRESVRPVTRRERRSMNPGSVIGAAARAALGGTAPTTPRRVGRFVIEEHEGALGGRGFSGNAAVCLTQQLEVDLRSRRLARGGADMGVVKLYETRDPHDRAHQVTQMSLKGERELMPAAVSGWRRSNSGKAFRCAVALQVPGAKARRYPASSMLGSGISIDSSFDWLHEARKRLAGIPGVGVSDESAYDVRAGLSDIRLRDVLRKRTFGGHWR